MANVFLVGAGPGDPGMLTLRAREIIETCDIMIYDYLANTDFLKWCKPDCEILYVGKKGGDHTLPGAARSSVGSRAATPTCSVAGAKRAKSWSRPVSTSRSFRA